MVLCLSMTIKHWLVLKRFSFLIATLYSLALAIVSLIQLKNMPDVGVSFGDKIFHFLAYSVLAFLWFSALFFKFKLNITRAIVYSALFSIIFGIILEALQGSATTYRSSDVYDAIANTLGVLFTVLILLASKRILVKKL